MKRVVFFIALFFVALSSYAQTKEYIWPKNKMPDAQEHQVAAKLPDTKKENFRPEDNRIPYLEWYDAPAKEV